MEAIDAIDNGACWRALCLLHVLCCAVPAVPCCLGGRSRAEVEAIDAIGNGGSGLSLHACCMRGSHSCALRAGRHATIPQPALLLTRVLSSALAGVNQWDGDSPPKYVNNTHLSARVGRLNPDWNQDASGEWNWLLSS